MKPPRLPATLSGYRIHLVGIKGTGMAALAEILQKRGAVITGSDGPERFYTDALLQRLGIPYRESFSARHVEPGVQLVVHSAAYSREENPELIEAAAREISLISYPQALGLLSRECDSSGICGSHGKTTTTALAGTLLAALDLPATVLAGSEVASFGNRSTMIAGDRYFVAETCEYRRHFLYFRPQRIVMTGVEADHLDYFRDLEDVLAAFVSYGELLPPGGELIFNQDDAGCREVVERLRRRRDDIELYPYGSTAEGRYAIEEIGTSAGEVRLRLRGDAQPFVLHIPGVHSAYNCAAAVALCERLLAREGGQAGAKTCGCMQAEARRLMRPALAGFCGSRRRSEVLGTRGGVLFLDDYGHHPTEVASTLAGLRSFYPGRRIVVDFMSHTYSRTRALLPEFARCFRDADLVVLHRIYASAREHADGSVDGRTLFAAVSEARAGVHYFEEPEDGLQFLRQNLKPGDLFVTMGAGDNWRVGRKLFDGYGEGEP